MVRHLEVDDQIRLFNDSVSRADLVSIPTQVDKKLVINVIRNEALEPTLNLIDRILLSFGVEVEWNIGPYDDTFQIINFLNPDADATILWVDWRRVDDSQLPSYIAQVERVSNLMGGRPLVVLGDLPGDLSWDKSPAEIFTGINSVFVECFEPTDSVETWREPRLKARNGTDLGNKASLEIAKRFGLQRIPELFLPILKCVVLDLDNTLYQGTLGEDGFAGIRIDNQHREIALQLKRMKSQGIFLAVASKNVDADFLELLNSRPDFPYLESDFDARRVSWGRKSESIREIAAELHIGLDSIAFVDDNPAEIQEVKNSLPGVQIIYAQSAEMLGRQLTHGPRFSSAQVDSTGGKRALDAVSNKAREAMAEGLDNSQVLHEELGTQIRVQVAGEVDVERVADMFARTNQFNLSLKRSSLQEIQEHLAKDDAFVVTATVLDKFADSGVIAAAFGKQDDKGSIVLNEFVISCRALGRGLETPLADLMISELQNKLGLLIEKVRIQWIQGPRNEPALKWLEQFSSALELENTQGIIEVDRQLIADLDELSYLLVKDSE